MEVNDADVLVLYCNCMVQSPAVNQGPLLVIAGGKTSLLPCSSEKAGSSGALGLLVCGYTG